MPATDLSLFFDPGDGLTVTGVIAASGITAEGYFDADIIEFNLDDTGPAQERYTFVCEVFGSWASVVGKLMTINGSGSYRITKATPDGTGLLTLYLFCEV